MTVVLVGPTAVGKSALAVALAGRFAADGRAAEVVNADSMLVYRGLDIGTAKPSTAELAAVPHHLVDVFDPRHTATVAEFQALARAAVADCRRRGVVPLVVGGSALYVRAVVDDFAFPGTDPHVRSRWEAELAAVGSERLHARLREQDPEAAQRIEPGNGRRVVRALEVIELTGEPFTARLPARRYALPGVVQLGLAVDRPTLDARIEQRVERMWAEGFVEEVRRLRAAGLAEGRTASRALGYRQILDFLDGTGSELDALRATVAATRRFARRQDRMFRQDGRIHWLAYDDPDLVERAYRIAADPASATPSSAPMGD